MSANNTNKQANAAVSIKRLSKHYKLYATGRDRLKEAFDPRKRSYHQTFSALRDIDLTVPKGSTVGIIGHNGSGKSTLLQCICGIVPPSEGEVIVDGRIAALLELGAGFNPEFSGRDNVFMNAAILGVSDAEIQTRLPDILAFANIGDYIDQPVRTYSSGMYVRLAFAVAIHVDPDILIVDEALAVGDIHFQAKCFERFHQFREQGTTVIFVTHDLNLVTRYCDSAYLLNRGQLVTHGNPREVVAAYHRLDSRNSGDQASTELNLNEVRHTQPHDSVIKDNDAATEQRYGNAHATIEGFRIVDQQKNSSTLLHMGEQYTIEMDVAFHQAIVEPRFAFTIKDAKGTIMAGTNSFLLGITTDHYAAGDRLTIRFTQTINLAPGDYLLAFGVVAVIDGEIEVYDRRHDALAFQVLSDKPILGLMDLQSAMQITNSNKSTATKTP